MDIDYDDIAQGARTMETVDLAHDGVQKVTDRAALIDFDGHRLWVPKSVIVECNDGEVTVHLWWAGKNGLG